MRILDLGLIPYNEGVELQLETLNNVLDGKEENTLFVLEHPKVITYGRQGGAENLHVDEGFLKSQGIELAQTTRGGNITCHFPGQLVAYPIWRVEKRPGGMRRFFHDMEEAVINTCAHFGVSTKRRKGHPGVWVDESRKICSMGIGVKRWVTYHGLALNVGPDISLFEMITLCGIQGATPTSISRESANDIDMKEAKDVFIQEFRKAFADSAVAPR
ncbi:Octanoyltransferase [Pseudodesulfovibrio profundus]|uniref:Octanoyltransferase n=1 Tax=Pseudodesulfovibrio profundus TaxID=57320 RepID=A0A2C8FEF1_9BACT|nr:lipoyl(octanoyl) transferase LipB [Pseudodesulfovibrio profundus]MBC16427.1 octanoyltransferase [Desulfovibrio sp.]SOB60838.1 Octanoyltransferase [Pseudodesulfovibrio profundus]|tara:strand:- start:91554 stop:92201 length:648 start_codon:yes stop_codon:yes gene_type:complete